MYKLKFLKQSKLQQDFQDNFLSRKVFLRSFSKKKNNRKRVREETKEDGKRFVRNCKLKDKYFRIFSSVFQTWQYNTPNIK